MRQHSSGNGGPIRGQDIAWQRQDFLRIDCEFVQIAGDKIFQSQLSSNKQKQ
jgi:hypothetical protein